MLKDHKDEAPLGIKFTYSNGLLYYTGGQHSQLVIAKGLLTKVLGLAHDETATLGPAVVIKGSRIEFTSTA